MVSIVGTPTLRRPFRRPSDARGGDWSEYAVYYVAVAPLAQRLEQRPFKSWVVGSNPTGGTSAVAGGCGKVGESPTGCQNFVLVVKYISQNGRVERTLNTIVPVAEVVASRNAMTSSERMM